MDVQTEKEHLEGALIEITAIAKGFGLDFYNIYFEICPAEILYSLGAYGMPTRFSHWTFGKSYHKMKTQHDYNLSRIYEMVINSNPCYAFLLQGNSLVQNKTVMAHVLAHCDFFKNNYYFSHTNRDMVESMSVAAERIRGYEYKHGRDQVELFLDSVLALQNNIDPWDHLVPKNRQSGQHRENHCYNQKQCSGLSSHCGGGGACYNAPPATSTPYDDLWQLDPSPSSEISDVVQQTSKKFPPQPEKDLLLFMALNARDLEDWQRDIILIIRSEMQYFWPQMQTKIINEGWATYWHTRIMRELDLPFQESLEFAKTHAGVIQTSKYHINPYHIGLKIFEDIEHRWDFPTVEEKQKYSRSGGEGRQKIFAVRSMENDISFIRNYLTKDLVEKLDLYLYQKAGYDWKVVHKDWEKVRDGIVQSLYNCALPYIVVEDGDYAKRGEIYLKHLHEGVDLDIYYLEKTLPHVFKIWRRCVHLETVVDGKKVLFCYTGEKIARKFI